MDSALTSLAESTLEYALRQGASEAAVSVHRSRFVEVKRRDGRTEALEASTSRGLSVSLYVDGRYSSNGTSLLRDDQVRGFVDEVLAMTRRLAPDPYRALPDPALYGPTPAELDLVDPSYDGRDMDWRLAQVAAIEATAREPGHHRGEAADGRTVISATASLVTQTGESLRLHSNGFRGERRGTSFALAAAVTARDAEGRRPEDHSWATAHHVSDLPAPEEVGREAARRALERIGGEKAESRRMTLLLENRAAGRLLAAFLEPLTGAALQQRRSCFEGRIGQAIASTHLTIVDDPLVPRGLGSRAFDEDGLAARRLPLISAGELQSYLIDVYYGRKLDLPPTTGSTSNLVVSPGDRSLAQLLADVQQGILVTSFLGGNSNAATGDFSFGVSGLLLRDGAAVRPVREMNITGNHLSLWRELQAVGNDPYPWSSWRTPSLAFADVQFSGL